MPVYAPPDARCRIYTYKEGLLSAVGHDLLLEVGAFEVAVEPGEGLTATFETRSIAVINALRDGVPDPAALSDKDRTTIAGYLHDDVLHSRRHPKITFRGTDFREDDDEDDAWEVEGDLNLHGRTRSLTATVALRDDRWVSRVRIHQPDYGIAPFRALMGTLRIAAHVEVELSIPADTAPPWE